jgi:hypothetical protein
VPVYDREDLPREFQVAGGASWGEFTLIEPLRAIRVEGAFDVRLPLGHALRDSLGVLKMPDGGWVAIDSNGDPFPIPTEQFDAIYRATGGAVTAKPSDMLSDEALAALVEERFGAWLEREDIANVLQLVDGTIDPGILEERGTLAKLRAIGA